MADMEKAFADGIIDEIVKQFGGKEPIWSDRLYKKYVTKTYPLMLEEQFKRVVGTLVIIKDKNKLVKSKVQYCMTADFDPAGPKGKEDLSTSKNVDTLLTEAKETIKRIHNVDVEADEPIDGKIHLYEILKDAEAVGLLLIQKEIDSDVMGWAGDKARYHPYPFVESNYIPITYTQDYHQSDSNHINKTIEMLKNNE